MISIYLLPADFTLLNYMNIPFHQKTRLHETVFKGNGANPC